MFGLLSITEFYDTKARVYLVESFESAEEAEDAAEDYDPDWQPDFPEAELPYNQVDRTRGVAVKLVEQFDGMTLDELSDAEQATARELAGEEDCEIDEQIVIRAIEDNGRYIVEHPRFGDLWIAEEVRS